MLKSIDPNKLLGMEAVLYYNSHLNRFQLGSVVFEAIEDPDDGYRSYFRELQVVEMDAEKRENGALATVTIQKSSDTDFDGYILRDITDNFIWLKFGTSNTDDYYPSFVFDPRAKKSP